MSKYRESRRAFGNYVTDKAEFEDLWRDYEALRVEHAAGRLPFVGIGLALRGEPLTPSIIAHVEDFGLLTQNLPLRSLSGFPIYVEEIGPIDMGPTPDIVTAAPFTSAYAKPPGGVSIAPVTTGYSGTLGCYAVSGGRNYLITNRHVLDASMNNTTGGPGVQQQSAQDGNTTGASVATATYYGALATGGTSSATNADVAAALMSSGNLDPRMLTGVNTFAALTTPNTIPLSGETVRKSGRTTGLTSGVVGTVTYQLTLTYLNGATYVFDDCITIANPNGAFQQGGDSGALLVNGANQPLGLMFAASSGSTGVAYALRIATALASLKAAANGADFVITTGSGAASTPAPVEAPVAYQAW